MPQTYLVTGASRGLGAEFVRQLRGKGHDVIAAVREPGSAGAAADAGARVVALDVDRPETFEAFAASLRTPVDVLLNNAGIAREDGTLAKTTPEAYEAIFRTNVIGPALLARALIPAMSRGSRRLIVNVSSQLGSIAEATQGFSYAYCISKAAVNMLSRLIHLELSSTGFTCVALDPGWNRTDMGGHDATYDPKDTVASMVALLERWTPADSGRFIRWNGAEAPW